MRATLSILGLYQREPTLFDEMIIPEVLDKNTLIDNILYESASLEAYYPNPDFMKFMIGRWSFMNRSIWEKMLATTTLEYNPIYNYDRTEEWSENEKMNDTRNLTRTDTETIKDTETRDLKTGETVNGSSNGDTTSSGTIKTDLSVSGYNDDMLSPRESTTESPDTLVSQNVSGETNRDTTDSGTVIKDGSINKNGTDNESLDRKRDNTRMGRAFGNIGVTTTQQMIEQERQVSEFNIYDYITQSFIKRFCLQVYS